MQASLEIVVRSYEKTKAEILWALKSITAGYSTKSFSDDSRLFQTMFPKKKKNYQVYSNGSNQLKIPDKL